MVISNICSCSSCLFKDERLLFDFTSSILSEEAGFSIQHQESRGVKDNDVHEEYLTQKCATLNPDERRVTVMLDEIPITSKLSYKGGKLEGPAVNVPLSEANTAQVFMTSSLLSKSKDVVAIIPVRNLNGDLLRDLCRQILVLLHRVGYSVLCMISDNNRINRNALSQLCGGTLQVSIPHPLSINERLFFLFDTVHIFKCIRNNWLCQNDNMKTFCVPACDDSCVPTNDDEDDGVLFASFSRLRQLYDQEKSSALKLAPGLNQKALDPTSTEKQNVNLMLKIFDQRNVVALKQYETTWNADTKGTRQFLLVIWRLWNILNVKHAHKHIRLRNEDCKPLCTMADKNVSFIQNFLHWLDLWKALKLKPRDGILSMETMTALQHTLTH